MEDLPAHCVDPVDVWRRVTPEQREHWDALLQADRKLVIDRKMQKEIHTERFIGQRANAVDFRTEERWRTELGLQKTEAARVADGGDQCRARQVGTHRRGDDRIFDTEHVAQRSFHALSRFFLEVIETLDVTETASGDARIDPAGTTACLDSAVRGRGGSAGIPARSAPVLAFPWPWLRSRQSRSTRSDPSHRVIAPHAPLLLGATRSPRPHHVCHPAASSHCSTPPRAWALPASRRRPAIREARPPGRVWARTRWRRSRRTAHGTPLPRRSRSLAGRARTPASLSSGS